MDEKFIDDFIARIINVAGLDRCQRIAAQLRDRLQEMDNEDHLRARDVALAIGQAAVFCDEAQSMIKKAICEATK